MISVRTLCKAHGDRKVLVDVSAEVAKGETIAIVGPSGGGKSTLLRVFNGLVPHFHGGRIAGAARVAGLDVVATPTRLRASSRSMRAR